MENEVYNNLQRIKLETNPIPRSKAIWTFDFQTVERALVRNGKIEEVWIDGELWYNIN